MLWPHATSFPCIRPSSCWLVLPLFVTYWHFLNAKFHISLHSAWDQNWPKSKLVWDYSWHNAGPCLLLLWLFYLDYRWESKHPHEPKNSPVDTPHLGICQLPVRTCACAKVSILKFLLSSDDCHSSTEICVTDPPETHSAAYSCMSSALSSSHEELRQWFQWSRRIKTVGVVVTFFLWLLASRVNPPVEVINITKTHLTDLVTK